MLTQAFWERKHDTHALLAWGGDRIVLVFRGTASFANVLADLSVSCLLLFWPMRVRGPLVLQSCTSQRP